MYENWLQVKAVRRVMALFGLCATAGLGHAIASGGQPLVTPGRFLSLCLRLTDDLGTVFWNIHIDCALCFGIVEIDQGLCNYRRCRCWGSFTCLDDERNGVLVLDLGQAFGGVDLNHVIRG